LSLPDQSFTQVTDRPLQFRNHIETLESTTYRYDIKGLSWGRMEMEKGDHGFFHKMTTKIVSLI
jgi:hypothetical protein